jgi:ABC-type multidrug transport system fused ATPase/permease subunit
MKNAFWITTLALFKHKRQLAVAAGGALLSAACFGAGLSMTLPTFSLLLQQKRSLQELIDTYILAADPTGPSTQPQVIQDAARWIAAHVPENPFWAFIGVMGIIAVLTVVGNIGRYIHEATTITVSQHEAFVLRSKLYRRYIHAPLLYALKAGTSDNIGRLVVDVKQLSRGHQAVLGRTVYEILKGVAAIVVAFTMDWRLTLIALIGAPAIAVLLRKFGKTIRRASKRVLKEQGRIIGLMHEALAGIRVVKVHHAEGYERRRFARMNRALFQQEISMRRAKALASPLVETIALTGVISVASIAAWHIFNNGVPPERFMTVLIALAGAGASLKPMTTLQVQVREADAAAVRILEALQTPLEPGSQWRAEGKPALPRHRDAIVFDNVVFGYESEDRPALRGVSLRVPHGITVAVVGPNGSGKTTLLSLLPRLIDPQRGKVLIDGRDLREVSLRSLRKQMAVVTQQSILFEGTIAQNIAYGHLREHRDRTIAAAKEAFADEFVSKLEHGYDAMLSEGGEGLSGGQRQRLCIARAILRDPAILILDEATSQIDADSEARITDALRRFQKGRTTFVIAHRLSTVVDADLIVVMADGQIVDQGPHGELLRRCDVYRTLCRTQLLAGDDGSSDEAIASTVSDPAMG